MAAIPQLEQAWRETQDVVVSSSLQGGRASVFDEFKRSMLGGRLGI